MSEYPNSDEEFELQYGDELQMLNEQEDFTEIEEQHTAGPSARKSLDFSTPKSKQKPAVNNSTITDSQPSTSIQTTTLESSFETDFHSLDTSASNTKKRGVEDLFGDIDDILIEDQLPPIRKKCKTDDEKLKDNLALIERILYQRKLVREKQNPNVAVANALGSYSDAIRNRHNISLRVPKYPFIALTRHDDERVYVRMHSEEYENEEIQKILNNNSLTGLMGVASKDLWNGANKLLNKKLDEENNKNKSSDLMDVDESDNSKLWVDMYKPRKYTELLSDESTNRTLLKWIKLWDKVVFKRRPKSKIDPKNAQNQNNNNRSKFFQVKELDLTLDEHDRPQHKVALLCGPPGLGKTTLAHMVARHAGYNVVEVNASDDRNVDSFKTALENATQMKSVIDREGRPNCLVFDEIDGAPAASIEFLVKFINGTAAAKTKKGKKQKPAILKRPIICICNDVYVAALRPLRQIAFVLNFPPTASTRLAERLMEISRHQHIKTDMGAMLALSEKSNNDIRSCLSVLHFFKTKNIPVTLSEICRASIGQKDMQKGLFTVWQDIFEIKRSKKGDDDVPMAARMKNILNTVVNFGDYDRLIQGIFENYPEIRKGTPLGPICTATEWFSYIDCMSKKIQETQNYTMSSYLPYGFVVWHFSFATFVRKKITYPSVSYEVNVKTNKQNGIIWEVLRGIPTYLRSYVNANSLRLDTLPMFADILVPNLRTINVSLYAPHERVLIDHVVDVMIDYNITYVQERNAEGNYVFYLDPNIDEVITFDGLKVQRKTLSYTSKQMLAREIEVEKMRRLERGSNVRIDESELHHIDDGKKIAIEQKREEQKKQQQQQQQTKQSEEQKKDTENIVPNHLQKLKAKSFFKSKDVVAKDFFGRVISKPAKPTFGDGTSVSFAGDIWFQYKEGYNNAVKRKVKISSLL